MPWRGPRLHLSKLNGFFIVSGEHESLPRAELLAVLESEGATYGSVKQRGKLVTLKSSPEIFQNVGSRALMCEYCGTSIGEIDSNLDQLTEFNFSPFLLPNESFAVRSIRVLNQTKHVERQATETRVGAEILRQVPEAKVNLNNPSKLFLVAIGGGFILCGLVQGRRPQASMHARRPRRRPVFHPSTMHPKLARCMVNLARPRPGELLLDPFCGVGGILLEASTIGCRVVGCDLSAKMLRGSRRNLSHFGYRPESLLKADARALPFQRVDSIATDPPYGTGASTFKSSSVSVLRDFLTRAMDALKHGRFLCVAAPETSRIEDMGMEAGFTVREAHKVRVHRSLTREIVVFQR